MDKEKLNSMVESIVRQSQGSYFAASDGLERLFRQLHADNVPSELISFARDRVCELLFDSIPTLAAEVRGGYLDPDRAATLAARYGHDSNALYNATKDAVRGCFY